MLAVANVEVPAVSVGNLCLIFGSGGCFASTAITEKGFVLTVALLTGSGFDSGNDLVLGRGKYY